LNGATTGGWVRFAKDMEQAGADAIELNTYALATSRSQTSSELELQLLDLVAAVTDAVKVPVSVKLSSSFTSVPHLVARLEDVGAKGVVLFNRFYQPDFDIETLEVRPTLHFSTPSELLPRLHWRPSSTAISTSTSPLRAAFIRLKTCSNASWPGPASP